MFASRASLVLAALLLAAVAGLAAPRAGEAAAEAAAPAEKLILRTYDVQELTLQVPDFPGPELGLEWALAGGGDLPVFAPPPPAPVQTAGAIQDMIRQRIQPESWQPGKGTSIEERAGKLVVIQTEEVHRQINALLQDLRAEIKLQVSVQALVVLADEKTAARMRQRKSLEFTAEEAEELVKAAGKGGLLAAPQVLCANGQRKHAATLQKHAFVAGFTGGGELAITPTQNVALAGTVLDVRLTLSGDRTSADVELRLTLAGDWSERPAEFATVVVPRLASRSAKPEEPKDKGENPAGAETAKPAVPEADTGAVLPFRGRYTLPSLRCWRLRNCLTVPLDRYVLAGTFRAPPFESGGKGDPAPRTVLVLVGVRPAAQPGQPAGGPRPLEPADKVVQRIYDVRDLSNVIPNFPGPVLHLAAGGAGGGGAGGAIIAPAVESSFAPAGTLQDMIKRTIRPESWGVEGTSIQEQNGQIIVFHVPEVQQQVAMLLAAVRAECKKRISIQGLAVAVDEAGAARLRLRRSVAFTAEEAEALFRAAGPKGVLAAAQIVCFNGQRVHLTAARQICYVSGYTNSGPSAVPTIGLGSEGWSLDVRPVLSLDRKAADVEMRFSMEGGWRTDQASAGAFATELPPAEKERGGRGKAEVLENRLAPPSTWSASDRGCPTVPVGKYVLAGTFQKPAESAAPGDNYLLLIKVDVEDLGRK